MLAIRILILGVALLVLSRVEGVKLLWNQLQASCGDASSVQYYMNIQVMDTCTFFLLNGAYYYYKRTCEVVQSENGNIIRSGNIEYSDPGCTNAITSNMITEYSTTCSGNTQWVCKAYDFEGNPPEYGPFTDKMSYMSYSISQMDYCAVTAHFNLINMYPMQCVTISNDQSQMYKYGNDKNGNDGLMKLMYFNSANCTGEVMSTPVSLLENVPMDKCYFTNNYYSYLNDSPASTLLQVTTTPLPVLTETPTSNSDPAVSGAGIGGIVAGCVLFIIAAVLIYRAYFPSKSGTGLADHDEQNVGLASKL